MIFSGEEVRIEFFCLTNVVNGDVETLEWRLTVFVALSRDVIPAVMLPGYITLPRDCRLRNARSRKQDTRATFMFSNVMAPGQLQ